MSSSSLRVIAPGNAAPAARPPDWRRLLRTRTTGFALVALLLLTWEASVAWGWVRSDNWPRFSGVLLAVWQGWASGELAGVIGSTLYRTFAGFFLGSTLGIVMGVLLGRTAWLDWTLRPLVEIQRTLPAPALLPPLILLLGVDDALKIVVIALAVLPPVFVNTYSGVKATDETLILTARTLGLSRVATMWKIVLPATVPAIAAGMRTALALALVVAVIAEMISGTNGIGFHLMTMQYAMRADAMYASVVSIAAAGYLMNRVFLFAEKRLLHWHASSRV